MKVFVILLTIMMFAGLFYIGDNAYGLWWPLSPQELVEQSQTIFVGTITEINLIDVDYLSQVARNGTLKESMGPETMQLEEYTVHVEEFLKNPQDTDTMKLLGATVSGVPGAPAKISGFDVGERVLFYLPNDEKQTHFQGQYLPESFKIPQNCDANNAILQPRLEGGNSFSIIQDDALKKENFVAGKPMKFVFGKDTGTLFGKSMDIDVAISNKDTNQVLFEKTITIESKPCQWITSAEWEFTPDDGDYRMYRSIKEGDNRGTTSYTGFSAFSGMMSPLKQCESGITANKIHCRNDLVLISKHDGTPACVTPNTKEKLVNRGWADPMAFTTSGDCSTDMKSYSLSKTLSDVYVNRLVLVMQPDSVASFCVYYKSNYASIGNHTITHQIYTGKVNLGEYEGSEVSVDTYPKNVSLEKNAKTLVKFTVTATQNAEGVYQIGIDQLGLLPLVVWEDRQSVGANEIPVYHGFKSSANKILDSVLLWYEGDDSLKYVIAEMQR